MNKCSVSDYNVQFIFNLNEKSIREIYRNILKIQNIELEYKIGLEILVACLMTLHNLNH